MEAFVQSLPTDDSLARFTFEPQIQVGDLSSILRQVWDTGRTQVEVGVPEGGETHWFTLHVPFHGPARPILEVSFGEGFRGTQTLHAVMDRQPYYATDSWVEPIPSMTHGRVWEVIREAPEGDPVGMMVEMALPMARLVEVMRLLEDMKAEGFTLDFVWRDPAPEASDD